MARTENTEVSIYANMRKAQKETIEKALVIINKKRFSALSMSDYIKMIMLEDAGKIICHANDEKFLARQVAANPSTQVK